MFILHLGYQSFAVPDQCASYLFEVVSVMKPLKSEGYGKDRNYQYSDEPLDINVVKLDARLIRSIDLPTEEAEGEKAKADNITFVAGAVSFGEDVETRPDYSILDGKIGE